jgi:ribose/xylose/arabinose/galactoside ABC-type transport system permease subunit
VPYAAGQVGVASAGEPEPTRPRDRLVFQLVWEAILLLVTLNALFLVYQQRNEIFGESTVAAAIDAHVPVLVSLLLLATAIGMSLRMGAINLSVPMLAFLVVVLPEVFVSERPLMGLAVTVGAAAAVTVVFVLLTLAFRIPAWAAGLACLFLVAASVMPLSTLRGGAGFGSAATWTSPGALWLFLGAAAVSVAGGLIGLLPGVRGRLSAVRDMIGGTADRDAASAFTLIAGTFVSLVLAALAGFAIAVFGGFGAAFASSLSGMFFASAGMGVTVTPLALIAVLLGGTSLWGRRGGIIGTVLGSVLVWSTMLIWSNLEAPASDRDLFDRWSGMVLVGLLVFGLVVSFALDRLGRPKAAVPDENGDAGDTAEMPSSPYDPMAGSLFDPSTGQPVATAPPQVIPRT